MGVCARSNDGNCVGANRTSVSFYDTWQLVINTGTTIVTFLMVFLIQNTQNRDARAMQLKLDELIRAVSHARNQFVDVENSPDEVIDELRKEFGTMREQMHGVKEHVERLGEHVKQSANK